MFSHSSLSVPCKLPDIKLSGIRDMKLKTAVFGNESTKTKFIARRR